MGYICSAMYGPDSGGARWICRGEHIPGHLLVKSDGVYLLDSSRAEVKRIHEMDNPGDEENETREVTYCPKCQLWNEKE